MLATFLERMGFNNMSVERVGWGKYKFGPLKVNLKCVNGHLVARL